MSSAFLRVLAFIDSLRVPDKPATAGTLAQNEARTDDTKFYQSLDAAKIYEFVRAYFDRKAYFLENLNIAYPNSPLTASQGRAMSCAPVTGRRRHGGRLPGARHHLAFCPVLRR